MSTIESNKTSATYTAFWPILIVLITVLVISSFELVNLLGQRQQLRLASTQLEKQAKQAQVVGSTLGKMSKELLLLSGKSAESKKIVQEFGIQIKQPQPAPAAKK